MNWYLGLSTIAFLMLSIVWKHKDWPNTFIKAALIVLTACGAFFTAFQNGWVIKH